MSKSTITISVDEEVARALAIVSPQRRRKIELLVNLHLRDLTRDTARLTTTMDAIGREAKARGLTPEKLDELLKDVS